MKYTFTLKLVQVIGRWQKLKTLKELPSFGQSDYLAPIVYLLYRKGVLTDDELNEYINSYNFTDTQLDVLQRIENMIKV